MNKLNLIFIIIGLFIASSCKLGGERDGQSTPSNITGGGGGGGGTPSTCNASWKNYCDYFQNNNQDPPQDCYTYGCISQGGSGGKIDCNQYKVVVNNCKLYKDNYDRLVDQNYKDATDQCCEDGSGITNPDRPDDPPASCYGAGIQPPGIPNLPDYRKISIVGHGNSAGVSWSSITDPRYKQYYEGSNPLPFFLTDSKFLIRFAAPPPNQDRGYNDSYGKSCTQVGLPFTKVKFTLGIRKRYTNYHFATKNIELTVGSCTNVIDITDDIADRYATRSDQLVFEIMNYQIDWPCNVSPNSTVCPYWPLPNLDCYKLDFQFSTDATKDLPD
jgi:hypothetical protein